MIRARSLAGLSLLGLVAHCTPSEEEGGGVVVVVTSDLSIPKDINKVVVQVSREGHATQTKTYPILPTDGGKPMPMLLDLLQSGSAGEAVDLKVIAQHDPGNGASPTVRVVREATLTVPTDRVSMLSMPLRWLCDGHVAQTSAGEYTSDCGDGKTCIAGKCGLSKVTLEVYTPGNALSGEDKTCMNVGKCFASAQAVAPDAACTLALPTGVDASRVNVAMITANGDGQCGADLSRCIVPIDRDAREGWSLTNGRIALPESVCEELAAGKIQSLALSSSCPAKASFKPLCGPWTPITVETQVDNAGGGAGGAGPIDEGGAGGLGPIGGAGGVGGVGGAGEPMGMGGTLGSGGRAVIDGAGGAGVAGAITALGGAFANGGAGVAGAMTTLGGAFASGGAVQGGATAKGGAAPGGAGQGGNAQGGGAQGGAAQGGRAQGGAAQGGSGLGGASFGGAASGGAAQGGTGLGGAAQGGRAQGGAAQGGAGFGGAAQGGAAQGGSASGGAGGVSACQFVDPSLEAWVRSALKLPEGPITLAAAASLRSLTDTTGKFGKIQSLEGIQCLVNLSILRSVATDFDLGDLSPLKSLDQLSELDMYYTKSRLYDLSPLADHKLLTKIALQLNSNSYFGTDLTPLATLPALKQLQLNYGYIFDLTPLAKIQTLEFLELFQDNLADITPLRALANLSFLSLNTNPYVRDIAPLAGLKNLATLYIAGTGVSEFSPLLELPALTSLSLGANGAADVPELDLAQISGLVRLTSLSVYPYFTNLPALSRMVLLRDLALYNGRINDLSPLSSFRDLVSLTVTGPTSADITPIASLGNLVRLDLSNDTDLKNLSPLSKLPNLGYVTCNYTSVSDLSPLRSLPALTSLSFTNSQIADLSSLVANTAFTSGDTLNILTNPLDCKAQGTNLTTLRTRGVAVTTDCP